jgi:hypothetical protein
VGIEQAYQAIAHVHLHGRLDDCRFWVPLLAGAFDELGARLN